MQGFKNKEYNLKTEEAKKGSPDWSHVVCLRTSQKSLKQHFELWVG